VIDCMFLLDVDIAVVDANVDSVGLVCVVVELHTSQ